MSRTKLVKGGGREEEVRSNHRTSICEGLEAPDSMVQGEGLHNSIGLECRNWGRAGQQCVQGFFLSVDA